MILGALPCSLFLYSPSGYIDVCSRETPQLSKWAFVLNENIDLNTSEVNVLQRTGSILAMRKNTGCVY